MPDAPGKLISEELERQIRETVRAYLTDHWQRSEGAPSERKRTVSRFPIRAVILDADLGSASFLGTPTGSLDHTAPNATVCRWSATDEEYEQTEQRLAVVNHSEAVHVEDTPGAAIPIDGHYWFFGACEPLESRPTPPWDV